MRAARFVMSLQRYVKTRRTMRRRRYSKYASTISA